MQISEVCALGVMAIITIKYDFAGNQQDLFYVLCRILNLIYVNSRNQPIVFPYLDNRKSNFNDSLHLHAILHYLHLL